MPEDLSEMAYMDLYVVTVAGTDLNRQLQSTLKSQTNMYVCILYISS